MSTHGGAPLPSQQPKYQSCPFCTKKGYYEYRAGKFWITKCKYCQHYEQTQT